MKTASLTLIAATGLCLAPGALAKDTVLVPDCQQNNSANQKDNAGKMPPGNERPIDLVICLDKSNSMDGLIGRLCHHFGLAAQLRPSGNKPLASGAQGTLDRSIFETSQRVVLFLKGG
jgi:hypothetical protein